MIGSALDEKYRLNGCFFKVALYFYTSIILPYLKYCCHTWAGAPNCFLDMLHKLQKWIWRTVDLTLAASRVLLTHAVEI